MPSNIPKFIRSQIVRLSRTIKLADGTELPARTRARVMHFDAERGSYKLATQTRAGEKGGTIFYAPESRLNETFRGRPKGSTNKTENAVVAPEGSSSAPAMRRRRR